MSALARLCGHYEHRTSAAEAWRADGGAVVGCMGADVPRELVEACGLHPLRLAPLPQVDATAADAILGPGVEPSTRRILAGLLAGAYPIDFLLFCHDSEHTVRLYTSLRALRPPSVPMHFVDVLHGTRPSSARYVRRQIAELAGLLAAWGEPGMPQAAIAEANRSRDLAAELAAQRRAGRVASAEALAVLGAGTALRAEAFNALLVDALDEIGARPARSARRVHVLGSAQDTTDVYAGLDALDCVVVGEEHSWGQPLYAGRIDEDADPVDALAAHYGAVRHVDALGAELALAWIRAGDDALAWSLPAARRRLGVPVVALESQPYDLDTAGRERLREAMAA
jgi:benzoyl-CoA reductase/2-hydroxyglutaryl-CoA dehydratase subunit BcrC/BadD/HgdB